MLLLLRPVATCARFAGYAQIVTPLGQLTVVAAASRDEPKQIEPLSASRAGPIVEAHSVKPKRSHPQECKDKRGQRSAQQSYREIARSKATRHVTKDNEQKCARHFPVFVPSSFIIDLGLSVHVRQPLPNEVGPEDPLG